MGFINLQDLDDRMRSRNVDLNENFKKSIENDFLNETRTFSETSEFDIFLSHRKLDSPRILALKEKLEEDYGLTVYVDWIEDKQLSRKHVTKESAKHIRRRMSSCKTLVLAYSEDSQDSLWIPWELGYFDGLKQLVSIMPIFKSPTSEKSYDGQEYLGIYPYVTEQIDTSKKMQLWVNDGNPHKYISYNGWMTGKQPYDR